MSSLHKGLAWTPALAWAGVIFFASAQVPAEDGFPMPFPHADKLIHAVLFGILSLFLWFALWKTTRQSPAACAGWAFVLASLYGVVDEVHQTFVPGRVASLGDVLADAAGAAVIFFLANRLAHKLPRWRRMELPLD